ncbi:DSD1 family PLP-dependent enzyme [Thiotrichales bacterium 19S3-7]|nr:DSD1 family PLP-dependent enzyme [Thiotrichales bacterium 19S3-7]MCF6802357.1 DSD1 family PLP-dependent enzyme [Thiotrichales bacterium 19S3-11]
MIGLNKFQLDTPALIIDKEKLITNIKRMQQFANQHHKSLRPHAKTHKCSDIAKLQLEYGAIGICTTKVTEALELAKDGIDNLLITSPVITHQKLKHLEKVLQLSPNSMVVCDSKANLKQLNELASIIEGKNINLIIDVDAGIGRTGLSFDNAYQLAIKANQLPHITLKGIQCYAGHFQHIIDQDLRKQQSQHLLEKAACLKYKIENATGLNNLIQTGSGTGTYEIDCQINGVTEIQPGSYTVMDKEYYDINYDSDYFLDAMTLITTVISSNSATHVTVDAGLKALYKDPTPPKIISHPELKYDWSCFGDEHGKVTGDQLPKAGGIIEMIVPHCDPTINLYDKFFITKNDVVIDTWKINLRGKCQ